MRRLLQIFFFCFLTILSYGQDKKIIDSLQTAVRRAPDKEKAQIYNVLAREYKYSDPEKAIEYVNEAFAYSKDFKNKKQLAISHFIFGECNVELRKFDIAKQAFLEGLNISRDIKEKELTSDILSSLGSLEDDLGNRDTAVIYLTEALEIAREINYYQGMVKSLSSLGVTYFYIGEFNKALEYFEESYQLTKEKKDTSRIATNLNLLAACSYYQNNYPKALGYYIEALKLSEELNNTPVIASNLLNIANISKELKKYDDALENYQKALKIFEELGDSIKIASCYNNLGILVQVITDNKIDSLNSLTKKTDSEKRKEVKKLENNYNTALDYLQKSIQIREKLNDTLRLATNYTNIATVQTKLRQYNEAIQNNKKALNLARSSNNQRTVAVILNGLGILYEKINDYEKALYYYNEGLKIANKLGILEYKHKNYEGLSGIYEAYGNYKEALKNYKLYVEKKDSIFGEELKKEISKIQGDFDSYRQKQEIESLKLQSRAQEADLKRQKAQKLFFGLGAIVVIIFLVFAIRQILVIRRKNVLLNEKNIQINQQKEEIEAQRDEIQAQRDLVMKQKEEITDSIYYAQRIQKAVLPSPEFTENVLPEHFILFRPRDIVSGDFYYITKKKNKVITVAADCTGHGVPGAFMSMLGVSFLNEIVNKLDNPEAHIILNHLRNYVKTTLDQTGKKDEAKDGMDVALTVYDFDNMTAEYAGA